MCKKKKNTKLHKNIRQPAAILINIVSYNEKW